MLIIIVEGRVKMGLYIDAYTAFESSFLSCEHVPSVIDMHIPGYSGMLRGLLTSDTTISLKNTFGAALPDVETLQLATQLVTNWSSVPAWIGASAQVWRGTDSVRFPIEFYLINYKPGLRLEEGLKKLAKLATMQKDEGPLSGVFAKVHGGYSPDILANNNQQFMPNKIDPSTLKRYTDSDVSKGTEYKGVIKIRIGTSFELDHLILSKIDISRSNVEVRNSSYPKAKPLYYRVQCQLQTCRAALETDVDSMFGGV